MPDDLQPPPEARLITRLREKPPRMSIREAARQAGISESRWRQIEHGTRIFRGIRYPETGPAPTIAVMTFAVGGTPGDLTDAGRDDAAGELQALLEHGARAAGLTARQKRGLNDWLQYRSQMDSRIDPS